MSFFDKFTHKKDSGFDDPFASSSSSFPSLDQSNPDPLIPSNDPFSSPAASQQQNFGVPPQQGGMPPMNFDINNPDINAQTGTPRPREREYSSALPSQAPASMLSGSSEKDLQLILAKLDAIKSELDSLHQRVRKIEQIAEADQQAAQGSARPSYGRW